MKVRLTKNALKHVMKSEAERTVKELGVDHFKICYMTYYQKIAKSLQNLDEIIVINHDCENDLLDYMEVDEDIEQMELGKVYVMLFDGYVSVFDLSYDKQTVMIREEDFFSLINAFILNDFLDKKYEPKAKIKRIKI